MYKYKCLIKRTFTNRVRADTQTIDYSLKDHLVETVNNHYLNENLIDIQDDFPQKRISKKKILPGENCQDESILKKRFVPNENLLRDCNWLDPISFSNIESMKHSDALQTICELAGVDRQVKCLELKQFASQFKNFLPDLISSSDLNYKNNTNTQTESSNNTESKDETK
ncbi:hypothetical protein QTP88_009309 [Uroleucon formosanum]